MVNCLDTQYLQGNTTSYNLSQSAFYIIKDNTKTQTPTIPLQGFVNQFVLLSPQNCHMNPAKSFSKRMLYLFLTLILIILIYVIGSLIHGTATDFQPEDIIQLDTDSQAKNAFLEDSSVTILNWNLGYGGLGASSNFFYDAGGFLTSGGKMVRAPKEEVEKNLEGIYSTVAANPVDIYLFQETDINSKRNYHTNMYAALQSKLDGYASTFAINYNAPRVPLPVLEPWNVMGRMESGLATYSKYKLHSSTRLQLPGKYDWPTRIFQLDRCLAVHTINTSTDKDLILINLHNSAYDDGSMKAQQMDFLKDAITAEYEKGNYVIVGGDWNQCPPYFRPEVIPPGTGSPQAQPEIAPDFMPADWTWAYDPLVPTNRKLENIYDAMTTPTTIIDFYLVSPNVQVVSVKGLNLKFAYSDHQPVYLEARLR